MKKIVSMYVTLPKKDNQTYTKLFFRKVMSGSTEEQITKEANKLKEKYKVEYDGKEIEVKLE